MVNTRKITHERFGRWEKKLEEIHATPAILLSVGHDHVSGQLSLLTLEGLSTDRIIGFLRKALEDLEGGHAIDG